MILHYNKRLEHFSILNFNNNQIPPSKNQIIINKSKPNFKMIINDIKDNNKENLRSNAYVKINNNTNYYNDIYNYLGIFNCRIFHFQIFHFRIFHFQIFHFRIIQVSHFPLSHYFISLK